MTDIDLLEGAVSSLEDVTDYVELRDTAKEIARQIPIPILKYALSEVKAGTLHEVGDTNLVKFIGFLFACFRGELARITEMARPLATAAEARCSQRAVHMSEVQITALKTLIDTADDNPKLTDEEREAADELRAKL